MATTTQPRARNELAEQARLIKWASRKAVRDLLPALRWLHHSPNGGKRDSFTGGQMKALGVKPGFPDLILPAPRGTCPGLAIEMKVGKGRTSSEQDEWLEFFQHGGWATGVCYTAESAREMLCEYFGLAPERVPPLDP